MISAVVQKMMECNRDSETELLKYLSTSLDRDTTTNDFLYVTIKMVEKVPAKLFGIFYKCRLQEDVTQKLSLSSKGSVKKIRND